MNPSTPWTLLQSILSGSVYFTSRSLIIWWCTSTVPKWQNIFQFLNIWIIFFNKVTILIHIPYTPLWHQKIFSFHIPHRGAMWQNHVSCTELFIAKLTLSNRSKIRPCMLNYLGYIRRLLLSTAHSKSRWWSVSASQKKKQLARKLQCGLNIPNFLFQFFPQHWTSVMQKSALSIETDSAFY